MQDGSTRSGVVAVVVFEAVIEMLCKRGIVGSRVYREEQDGERNV